MRPLENWVYKDPGLQGKANQGVTSVGKMVTEIFALTFFLTVGNLAHCQDWENLLFVKMEEVLEKQEASLSQLKEMQEKQEHVEGKLQELRFEMEHLKGIHQETKDCLGREDLEHFKNISLAGQRELESFLHQEISGVISLLETDECSEGSHNCGDYEACTDKLVGFTCYCTEGFSRNGSHCEEFSCEPSGKVYEGLGCIKAVYESLTWHQMNATCQEAGWRFVQDIKIRNEKDVDRAFPYGGWVGVYEGKWLESGLPLQEDLWEEGHRPTDPARRCGYIMWNFSSPHLYTVNQYKCSDTALGYCQYVL
ncbi:uncharacterized protein LOC135204719 isoform X2 [Macrobrachium nipponense]|uniref:uncharacterized protein LOC135204719 isoform X2 n=1 Tax=Macrobrachium nipponense TaxID=159736 RepID=UPI0030C8627F